MKSLVTSGSAGGQTSLIKDSSREIRRIGIGNDTYRFSKKTVLLKKGTEEWGSSWKECGIKKDFLFHFILLCFSGERNKSIFVY